MLSEYNYHTKVMGCDFDMIFIANSVKIADSYFTQALQIAQEYEKRFSRFDEQSELSKINRKILSKMSDEFLDVYNIAYNLYKKTNAKFNPLVQVARIGYNKSFEEISKEKDINVELKNEQYNISMDDIIVSQNKITLQDTQELDFGGFLKGYVAQRIVEEIKTEHGVIINIGGDMYVQGRDEKGQLFSIDIINPYDEKQSINFSLQDKALCTSGIYRRKWNIKNQKKHHILNSKIKDSAQTDIVSASVIHKNGVMADAYATLAVAEGSERAVEFFKAHNIDFVIICKNNVILMSDSLKK